MSAERNQRVMVEVAAGLVSGFAVIAPTFRGPAIQGNGNVDFLCSNPLCREVLMQAMRPDAIQGNVAITCNACGRTSTPGYLG